MIPFFAGNVVEHYVRWRPEGLLAIIWVLFVIRIASELLGNSTGTFLANGGLACVTAFMCWKVVAAFASPRFTQGSHLGLCLGSDRVRACRL